MNVNLSVPSLLPIKASVNCAQLWPLGPSWSLKALHWVSFLIKSNYTLAAGRRPDGKPHTPRHLTGTPELEAASQTIKAHHPADPLAKAHRRVPVPVPAGTPRQALPTVARLDTRDQPPAQGPQSTHTPGRPGKTVSIGTPRQARLQGRQGAFPGSPSPSTPTVLGIASTASPAERSAKR